jgi:hypothetical protein
MSRVHSRTPGWLIVVVLAHLVISVVHGAAHANASVPLSPAASLFVYIVILAGPLIGLALLWPFRAVGAWVVACTMTASLVFGVLNHFVFASLDHVSHVDPQWQPLFATTAALLALTEGLGSGLAIRLVRGESLS